MELFGDRIRHRVTNTGYKIGQLVKIGQYQVFNTNTNAWQRMSDVEYSWDAPYLVGEFCRDEVHPGPPWRSGGPFQSLRSDWCIPYALRGSRTHLPPAPWSGQSVGYVGGFAPGSFLNDAEINNLNTLLGASTVPFPAYISSWSDKAWHKSMPKLEKAGLSVMLAEARDIPRMLRSTARQFHDLWILGGGSKFGRSAWSPNLKRRVEVMRPGKLSDTFLNYQFGWVPFVSDLIKLDETFWNSKAYMQQISDANGKWMKRSSLLFGDEKEELLSSGSGCAVTPGGQYINNLCSGLPRWEVTLRTYTKISYASEWLYYRPEFDQALSDYSSAWANLQRNLLLYGARITPSNIYKATPWSWLIDWFSNVGDQVSLANAWADDSMVCKFLYLMHRRVKILTFRQFLPFKDGPEVLSWERILMTKQRAGANSPYGLSLSWNDLTPRQLAILAALKITR